MSTPDPFPGTTPNIYWMRYGPYQSIGVWPYTTTAAPGWSSLGLQSDIPYAYRFPNVVAVRMRTTVTVPPESIHATGPVFEPQIWGQTQSIVLQQETTVIETVFHAGYPRDVQYIYFIFKEGRSDNPASATFTEPEITLYYSGDVLPPVTLPIGPQYRIYPTRVQYLVTNGVVQHTENAAPPYSEYDVYGSVSYQGYKYARFYFDVSSLPRSTRIISYGFAGALTDKQLYGSPLQGRIVFGHTSPNGYGNLGIGAELGIALQPNVIGSETVYTPLEVDQSFPANITVGEYLDATWGNNGELPVVVGLGRRTWGQFSNLVGIRADDAYLVIEGVPSPADAREENIVGALDKRASFPNGQQHVPREFRVPGPYFNMTVGSNTEFDNVRIQMYRIRIRVTARDAELAEGDVYVYAYGYLYLPGHTVYMPDAMVEVDSGEVYITWEGDVGGAFGEYETLEGVYVYMSFSDTSGGADIFAVEVEEFTIKMSGDTPEDVPEPPQPEFVIEKDREMLDDPPEWWEHTPDNVHIGYLINLGDDVSGSKPMQHLVTLDVPGVRVVEGTIANHGLVIAVADHNQGSTPVYTLPVPGASSTIKYDDSPKMMYRWRSKMFVFPGRTTLAAAKVVTCGCGDLIFRLYERGREVFATYVCNSEPFRLPPNIVGVEFQVELQGTAEVHEVHVASSMRELIEEG